MKVRFKKMGVVVELAKNAVIRQVV